MKVLELYSGMGGMHFALEASGISGAVIASIDINTVANQVYKHNFPKTNLLNRNIQGLSIDFIRKLNVDTILMSPPCQPFTRNGLKKDVEDKRTNSFMHVLKLLPELSIKNILIENVKGFECSEMRNQLINTLKQIGYIYQEFILSPHQFGVPNTRHRYYCLAKNEKFCFETSDIKENIEVFAENYSAFPLTDIIEYDINIIEYLLSDNTLKKRAKIIDICFNNSTRSCCFTKAYGRYVEGTGSIYTEKTKEELDEVYNQLDTCEDYVKSLKKLNLRYFTPKEVSRVMCFPEKFSFPLNITRKQCYNLLGNSINVKVVSELIKLLNK